MLAGLGVVFLLLLVTIAIYQMEQRRHKEELRADLTDILGQLRANLETGIKRDVYLTRGLIAFVATHPDLDDANFQKISRNILSNENSIRNIGLAPDNIVSFVYPLKGNEKAIGLDYRKNKQQWPSVKRAMEQGVTIFAGPVDLVQGGRGFISRTPVYLDVEEEESKEKYWGLANVVIDYRHLFEEAGFYNDELKGRIAIREKKGGKVFDGEEAIFAQDPVLLDVVLPGVDWQVAAVPDGGWGRVASRLSIWIQSGGIFITLLAGFFTYLWFYRMTRARCEIESHKKKAEDALIELLENKQFLVAIFENIPNMIFIKDARDLRFIMFNRAGEELTGYPREHMIGKNDHDFFPKDQADFFTGKDREVLQNKKLVVIPEESIQTRHKGERILHTKKIPLLDEKGNPLFLLGISDDITERKQVVESLRESEARFKVLHNASFGGIAIHDKGIILDCNKGLAEISGYGIDELIGMDGLLLIVESKRQKVLDNILRGYEKQYEVRGLRKNGDEYPLLLEARNIPYQGRMVRVTEFRDLSDRKKIEAEREILQEQLRQAQKMEAIGTLAGGIAHDFNNMLGGILGAAEMIALYLPGDTKVGKYQAMIVQSAKRAANLTEQLLAFARTSPKLSTAVDLHTVIDETLVLVRNTVDKRVLVETALRAEERMVVGDPSLLQSMFLNLCINGTQAMQEGGTLTLLTRKVELDEKTCADSGFELSPGCFIEIVVKDSGEGIAQEHLARIFDPFFTTKKQGRGTGLGLASVYGTIQQHNGAISVTSEVDSGTTFTLLLPLSGVEPTNLQAAFPAIQGAGRILVVDDEEVMRITALEILEDLGYVVITAENGWEALQVFEKEGENLDLVLLDMIMPKMNGKDCFQAMRKMIPAVKVILSSGFLREEDLKALMDDGLKGFIRKPYTRSALSRVIHDVLQKEHSVT